MEAKSTAITRASGTNIVPYKDVPKHLIKYMEDAGMTKAEISNQTESEIRSLGEALKKLQLGVHASTISLCSPECTSYIRCPLAILKRPPFGFDCPIELDIYETQKKYYTIAIADKLGREYDEIYGDLILMGKIGELVECDIQEIRANSMIAEHGMTDEVPILATEGGYVTRMEEHQAMKIKREIKRRRDQNLKQLIATPEMVQRMKTLKDKQSSSERIEESRRKANALMQGTTLEISSTIVEENKDGSK